MLDQLNHELVRIGVPVHEYFRPGLSRSRVVELTAPFGLEVGEEAMAWWRWRNGSIGHLRPAEGALWLERSLEIYQTRRQEAERAATEPDCADSLRDPDIWWHPRWLPFNHTSGAHLLVIDCSTNSASRPLRHIDWGIVGTPGYAKPLWPSISSWVTDLVEELRSDCYRYDGELRMLEKP